MDDHTLLPEQPSCYSWFLFTGNRLTGDCLQRSRI